MFGIYDECLKRILGHNQRHRSTEKWRRLLVCLLLPWAFVANAAEIRISGNEAFLPLAQHLEVFEDKSAGKTIDQIVEQADFARQPALLHPGLSSSAIWLKAEFANTSTMPLTRWLSLESASLRDVSFFVRQDSRWRSYEAGLGSPFDTWPVAVRYPAFPLRLEPLERRTVYIRVASPLPMVIDPTAWKPEAFLERDNRIRLIDGLMLGGLIVTAWVGILLVFMFRDRAFIFNALATATYVLGEASAKGYGFMYLWPHATEWAARCLPLFPVFGVSLNVLFVRDLLLTHRKYPRIDKALLLLLATECFLAVAILFGDAQAWARLSFAIPLPATAALFLTGIYAMLDGNRAARYYTAAYAVLTLGSLAHIFALAGFSTRGYGGEYALPLAMLLSNGFLMMSVVYRVIQVKEKHKAAQVALLAERASRQQQLEREVEERTTELQELNRQLEQLAVTDALTGLANRRRFDEALATEWSRARRSGRPIGIIMIDVDYFKKYNDHYGHQIGDECLKTLGRLLEDKVRRAGELVARYGGEEFIALTPNTDDAGAMALAESIRCALETLSIPHEASPFGKLTMSIGVAAMTPDGREDASDALARADEALYRAKHAGRNCVVSATSGMPAARVLTCL